MVDVDRTKSEKEKRMGLIIGIIIFTLLGLFVVIILIVLLSHSNDVSPPEVTITNGYFMSSCANTACNTGLICNGTDFTCRYGTGTVCNSAFDCGPGLTCSGICVAGPYGSLDAYCPCNEGYECQINTDGISVCKGISGTVCSQNRDCISNFCYCQGDNPCICVAGSPDSYPCKIDSDCSSNNCSNSFCQPPNRTTGTLGASCSGNCLNLPSGTVGASCASNLTCSCIQGPNTPGVCIKTNQGIGDLCSTTKLCSNELVCYNTSGVTCGSEDLGCQCLFPYTNPNTVVNKSCINGMNPRGSLCLNGTYLGCNSGTMCNSNSCVGPPVTVVYNFATDINYGTDFLSATRTSLMAGFTGPTNEVTPYKMFGTSNGFIDTIYLIDRTSGFYSITYDTFRNKAGIWTQLFSNKTSYGTLDDVSYQVGSTRFLVSFSNSLYLWDATTNIFTLFNNGIQYTTSNQPLTIDYLSISSPNPNSSGNDILICSQGTTYIKQASDSYYSIARVKGGHSNNLSIIGTTGPTSFYYDTTDFSYNNIAFVANYTQDTITYEQILQFSGSSAGNLAPLDIFNQIQYLVFDYNIYTPTLTTENNPPGMISSSTIMLTTTNTGLNVVALNYSGTTTFVPYNFNSTSRCVATNNAFYIINKASCI